MAEPEIHGPLCLGSHGDDIKVVQTSLNSAPPGASLGVDGRFGINTHKAVMAFQRREGLKIDGVVGPETAGRLGLSYGHALPRASRTPRRVHGAKLSGALEIVAQTLITLLKQYLRWVDYEIRNSGAMSQSFVHDGLDVVGRMVEPDLLSGVLRWGRSESVDRAVAAELRSLLLLRQKQLRRGIEHLGRHQIGARELDKIVGRINRLDVESVGREIDVMLEGSQDVDETMKRLGLVMRGATQER